MKEQAATMAIPKPEVSTWTDDQWKAIASRGSSMLVAAAAGSGKTAVLVERIIRRISDPAHPLDVDRLLVATFTKAAAAEMRHRISEALEKALVLDPESEHLSRQLALIPRAFITTLHSFCMEVIQKHYQSIGLDPAFRIANETESALLRQELLEELLEERYGSTQEGDLFWRLADSFSGDKSDDGLFRLVQRLYDDSRSHPWPDHWLNECVSRFELPLDEETDPGLATLRAAVRLELKGTLGLLREALRLAEEPGGPAPYIANLVDDLQLVSSIMELTQTGAWEQLHEAMQGASFGKLKACKGDDYDKQLQEQVKKLRTEAKDKLAAMREEWFGRSLEQYSQELETMAPLMRTLVELVAEFGGRYQAAKQDKGLVDFADLEHYCLRILSAPESTPDCPVPSQAALEYREQFAEVLLDEYQDTNRVQEAIVAFISHEQPGNRFLVGDVKQSIYRFRLAEPGLFQEKYKSYQLDGTGPGLRIDLSRNFRSRAEVVDATNYIFRQVMNESVGEIDYDERAELVCGAVYPEVADSSQLDAELILIDRTAEGEGLGAAANSAADSEGDDGAEGDTADMSEARELEAAQLEGRLLAQRIRTMLGEGGGPVFQVYDKSLKAMRDMTYRDVVVLLRATQQWAPVLIEELAQQGIPAYAELNTGYFGATEVQLVLSLLRIIDNPYQDIPLAGVLRSPIVGLDEEELALLRIYSKRGSFFDAVRAYIRPNSEAASADVEGDVPHSDGRSAELQHKLKLFYEQLKGWRQQSLQGPLADLIWDLYRQTGYFDFVGGLAGGEQRQANLRALYDRAKQYEATSLRGLFRFLRFVERMQKSGGDLGTARALGEQENVVRIMTIHKSKGLEFPVVFVAGCGKLFNKRELTDPFLVHRELGFGPKLTETDARVSYPTLPWLAIKQRIRMESIAEEMRVLYVALTRAKEKLILTASVRGLEKLVASWARYASLEDAVLPDDTLAEARCYLDWIGPALIRHPDAGLLRDAAAIPDESPSIMANEQSRWQVHVFSPDRFASIAEAAVSREAMEADPRWLSLQQLESVEGANEWDEQTNRRLSWQYAYPDASKLFSKTSVTELKRLSEHERLLSLLETNSGSSELVDVDAVAKYPLLHLGSPDSLEHSSGDEANGVNRTGEGTSYRPLIVRRPRFLEQQQLNAAERGSVFHLVMQHVPLGDEPSVSELEETLADMVQRELLTEQQRALVDVQVILAFYRSELGQRLLASGRVYREVPFSFGLPAAELYAGQDAGLTGETVMLQGVIDCLFEEESGLVLLDYKTDRLKGSSPARVAEKYRLQLGLYARALEQIWKKPVIGTYIFLFDGAHVVRL
ncbi:helicase-exonuclease AddAB subunit AddA [Paenibacillus sp. YYML68]|uniref:helicase-exonuclease AddAB subunit AddA n=1 Tax=Paenibacillus sp. YYML68 TaxID=2909250 RepID=UPI00248FBD61|nr:helicase-exonuclease AddAB subunit AddA [Paenibacillus sp. YYML68]